MTQAQLRLDIELLTLGLIKEGKVPKQIYIGPSAMSLLFSNYYTPGYFPEGFHVFTYCTAFGVLPVIQVNQEFIAVCGD